MNLQPVSLVNVDVVTITIIGMDENNDGYFIGISLKVRLTQP
ncbi:hypothetical protein BTN49_2696 [Candidatus Enterovibrio escicola]|uniref:Uncharacterized protein n=1 Tax=Candidatus Enterovibrio escicola TaxID=1927127 RepID=A0A2A5T0J7_9GAMM|nr:hypothetical protein BTN49_2696 [Candidatus Enterovibrio escacola]